MGIDMNLIFGVNLIVKSWRLATAAGQRCLRGGYFGDA